MILFVIFIVLGISCLLYLFYRFLPVFKSFFISLYSYFFKRNFINQINRSCETWFEESVNERKQELLINLDLEKSTINNCVGLSMNSGLPPFDCLIQAFQELGGSKEIINKSKGYIFSYLTPSINNKKIDLDDYMCYYYSLRELMKHCQVKKIKIYDGDDYVGTFKRMDN